jgi:N-6 DNA Methylase
VTLRAIHNHRNFFSDYWLGTLTAARGAAGPRLSATEVRRRMRRLTRLIDSLGGADRFEPARFRERFARPVLADILDFAFADESLAPHVHYLRPLNAAPGAAPVAVVYLCYDAADLDRPVVRQTLDMAMGNTDLRHGLILTPTTLRLIRRAGDGPRLGALDVALSALREVEDEASLQAAYRILSAGCFVAGTDGRRPIDVLEAESREHSAKVSTELKDAVFQAAGLLVGAFQRDVAMRPEAFDDRTTALAEVRDAGFLALYRLLFILYAESRDERLAAHRLYRESYGLESLIAALLAKPPETLAANRTRIWARLSVLFRVFNEGLAPNLPNLENIPPRGGRLFSETTPEGALLNRLRVEDRTARDVLLAIATTRPRRGVGRERVSFRELEIEQLGSVYEGLLEYDPAVADALRLAVRVGGHEMVLTPDELVFLCQQKHLALCGDPALVTGTSAEHLHPANAPDEEIEDEESDDEEEETEEEDDASVRSGQPIRLMHRLESGTFYFRPGGARKASGSYYTPTPMVDFLVHQALGPLTAGRTAREIEQLRVVDLACGSAHFLVGAARFLGTRLCEAYRAELGSEPPAEFAPPSSAATTMRLRWAAEGAAWCRRRIVERCLYGVDINPAAVQLAQVSLWIESLAGDRPLSFFAHHIRVGNSLQGTFADHFDTPPDPQLAGSRRAGAALGLFESTIRQRIEAAFGERRLIDAELPPEIRADTPEEFAYKEDRLCRSEAALAEARLLMDLRSAAPYVPAIWTDLPMLSGVPDPDGTARARTWWDAFERVRARERFFHWELEFPEVLLRAERPGFDAVLGNPPWDKVLPNKKEFYADVDPLVIAFKGNELDQRIRGLHREHPGLEERFEVERERTTTFARVLRKGGDFPLAKPQAEEDEDGTPRQRRRGDHSAHEDLSKYFVDRSLRLARTGGAVGLVVPSVVYNGDGCVGIRQHLLSQASIAAFYGFENRRRIFPIHAMYKFANLVARMGAEGSGAFDAAFMRHDVTELSNGAAKPWMVRITRDEVEQLSPETLALLEFRGPVDQEIVRHMSLGRPTLGGTAPGAWGTRLISWRQHQIVYNASEDKDLFTLPGTSRLHTPVSVLGPGAPQEPEALLALMRAAGFWPVYEGKHVEQYLVGVKPVRWWLSVAQAEAKYGRVPRKTPTLVFRETASNTNQRTCIAALLPASAAASHKLTGVIVEHVETEAALTVLNSLCFDFLLRLRSAGTNVSFTYILPVAVPSAAAVNALPRIPTRFAPTAGVNHISEEQTAWPALWDADRAVAEAYGLGPEEFTHILDTFPVWLRRRSGIAEFYRSRLRDWSEGITR